MSYGLSGKRLSPPDWLHGAWRQPTAVIATAPVTLSWEFTEDNAVNYSHGPSEELTELTEEFDNDRINIQEYYARVDALLAERSKTTVLDFKDLEYPVIGENSSAEEYTIRYCYHLPGGDELRVTYRFEKTSYGLNYRAVGSILPVELIRD